MWKVHNKLIRDSEIGDAGEEMNKASEQEI